MRNKYWFGLWEQVSKIECITSAEANIEIFNYIKGHYNRALRQDALVRIQTMVLKESKKLKDIFKTKNIKFK